MNASNGLPRWLGWILAALALALLIAGVGFHLPRPVPHWIWWGVGCAVLLVVAAVAAGFVFALAHMPD